VVNPFSLKNIREALGFRRKEQLEPEKPRRRYEPVLPRDSRVPAETTSQLLTTLNHDPHGINKT